MKTFLKTILVSLYEKKNNIYQKDVNYILKKTYNICMKCWMSILFFSFNNIQCFPIFMR